MKIKLLSAAAGPSRSQALKPIQARNNRNVIWILMSVPPMRPIVSDHGI